MSHKGHDDSKCGVNHHPCRTLSYTLEQRAKDDDVIQINGQDGTPYPMKKQHLVLRNITLIGIEGKARIAGGFSVIGSYLFADVARSLNTPPEQVSINLVNLKLTKIGIIKLKNTLTSLNIQVVDCTVSKMSKSSIVDSSAAKTTVIFKKSIIRHVSKGLQVRSKEFSLSMESSKIDNSGGSYPGQDCPQFIVTDDFESLVAHFRKSSFEYTFLIDLATSRQKKSNVSIIDSVFDDDNKNVKDNGCFSGITLRNTTALIVNSNFTNIISKKSLIKAIASFVTFKECIFSNISSKLGMFLLSSSIIASFNKTNAINNKLNESNYGSIYLQSTEGVFQNCTFDNNTVNGLYGNGGAVYIHSSNITVQQCLFKENTVTYSGGAIKMVKARGIFVNCTFEKNSVKSRLQQADFGGAVCALDNSHLTMHQCIFKENTATYLGGAIYIHESQSLFESCIFERNKVNSLSQDTSGGAIRATGAGTIITIKQCLFKENAATDSGGAIDIESSRSLFLKNSTFVMNTVKNLTGYATGGAINLVVNSDLIVEQCLFKGNTATYSCGAIFMQETRGSFENCTFDRNSVTSHLQKSHFGGAICALDNSHLAMHQCSFKYNTATYSGGATYILKSQCLFESCIFKRNKVISLQENTSGGAISAAGADTNITIKQCLFKENAATYGGGAIEMKKAQGSFVNCTFERNSVKRHLQKADFGGAICALDNSHLTMHQCIFKDNTATYVGGATYIQKSQTLLESCIFERNKVNSLQQDTSGGAISATDAGTNITIKQCLFKENTATYSGGAIDMQRSRGSFVNCTFGRNSVKSLLQKDDFGGAISAQYNSHLTMHQCIFEENAATYVGGAIYIHESQSLFESCIFERNKVNSLNQDTSGGAIRATGAGTNITIKQCLFKENAATDSGGAIDIESSRSLLLKNSTFVMNTVKNLTGYATGGAINLVVNSDLIVEQCLFKGNTATYSCGAIFMQETRGSFENCTFDRNSVTSHLQKSHFGGAICALDNSHLAMHQCSFKYNTATGMGGATYIQKSHSLFESCIFEKNMVKSLQQDTRGGAIVAYVAGNVIIKQCLFKENTATYSGGATYILKSQSLFESCIFERNEVISLQQNTNGGAISAAGADTNITIKQCLFKENAATYGGGAIEMKKAQGSFVNCTFERNSVKSRLQKDDFGGAICALDNSNLTMHLCIFNENTATYVGGAIYILESQSLFESCIFERNKVNNLQQHTSGGAISATDAGRNITIKQCLFKENTATYRGGAIDMQRSQGSFVNCTFERNSVKSRLQKDDFGGAIYAQGNSHLTMHQCIFKENTATYVGGATYIQESQSLFESCIFERNKVNNVNQDTSGGAIRAIGAGTNITIRQCLFKENAATDSGGAIDIESSRSLLLKNSTFVMNTVKNLTGYATGGAINLIANSDLIVQQCLFKGNTATYSCGAIFMQETRGLFENCTFDKNSVKSRQQKHDFGGAICAQDNSHLTMHQCIIKENTATYSGGATLIKESHSLFESCIFERNKVNSLNQDTSGGAIRATGAGTNITIKQCLFKENAATNSGGAIDIEGSRILLLKNSTFVRNTVKALKGDGSGGAIVLIETSDITVQQCWFKENTATDSGGAIFMQETRGSFENCTFDRNFVKSCRQKHDFGGALCTLNNSHLTMHQCIFKENTAIYSGGAIFMQETQGSFENCTFVSNAVQHLQVTTFGGAISSIKGSFYLMTQCLFMKNTATFYGGACHIQNSHGSFENCTFEGKV